MSDHNGVDDNEVSVPVLPRFNAQEYHCHNQLTCNKKEQSQGVLVGWYLIRRRVNADFNLKTVSIVCSFECLLMDAANESAKRLSRAY